MSRILHPLHKTDMTVPEYVKLLDVEDRPVISISPSRALVYSGGDWRLATVYMARKALLDGYRLQWEQFALQFPEAAESFPRSFLQALAAK